MKDIFENIGWSLVKEPLKEERNQTNEKGKKVGKDFAFGK